ncbi:MAG TPA: hypothetical protein PKC18_01775 [Lacipirellulaceae bacterium]|nr:hypothetical protein [Lacipirellulaceae bacterium]HMP07410.1 hypothetical protein [Lacipirellulaceae bacterium]
MFLAHSFRLRDPWQFDRLPGGAVQWSRVFHRPTGLEPDDALWLVCSGLPCSATISVNGEKLTSSQNERHEYDVTLIVMDANRVVIELPPEKTADQEGDVRLLAGRFPYDVRLGVVAHP